MKKAVSITLLMLCIASSGVTARVPLASLATLSTPARADPPRWAPAHGRRARGVVRYRFYPALELYFDPVRNGWFFFSIWRGGWTFSTVLPSSYVVLGYPFVELDIASPQPYLYHSEIMRQYPRARYDRPREQERPVRVREREARGERRLEWGKARDQDQDSQRGRVKRADRDKDKDKDKDRDNDRDRDSGHGGGHHKSSY